MAAASVPTPPSSAEGPEVDDIRTLLKARRFAEAAEAAARLAAAAPGHREALYLLARAQRQQHQVPEALATLEALERHPVECFRSAVTVTSRSRMPPRR